MVCMEHAPSSTGRAMDKPRPGALPPGPAGRKRPRTDEVERRAPASRHPTRGTLDPTRCSGSRHPRDQPGASIAVIRAAFWIACVAIHASAAAISVAP